MAEASSKNHAVSVWSEAHPLGGDDNRPRYEKVILPLAVLRRPRTLRSSGPWESQTSSFSAGLCSSWFTNYISADLTP